MRTTIARLTAVAVVLFCGAVSLTPWAMAGEPMEVIRTSTNQVLGVLKDPQYIDRPEAREQRIWDIAYPRFDWEEMAQRSLAVHWRERTPGEKKEFVELFSRLLHKSYIGKITQYKDEKIEYVGEEIKGPRAEVKTKILSKGLEIPVEYRLLQRSSGWLIYDVIIEGVSLVNNYRNQFNRIVVSSGYKDLVQRMRNKWDELLKEEADKSKKAGG
ncbi:MAG: MlaC/ttg2D family ABC transporter substrate-binding protein [Thermodesulfobacteriota bacterium]